MDQGWISWRFWRVLVVFLIVLRNAVGFKGGSYSNTYPRWSQPLDNTLSPRSVQSSLSDAPVAGTFSVEEVGSGVFPERSQKSRSRFANLHQYVKGGVSSRYESASHVLGAPSGSASPTLALPQTEHQAGSLGPLQLQGSSSSSVQDVASQITSGQSLQNQYTSSSQGGSGLQSVGFSPHVSLQGEGSNGLSSPDISGQFTPDSHTRLSSSSLITSSQATSDQSSPSLHMSSFPGSSGLLFEASGSASGQGGVSSYGDQSFQSQGTSTQYAPGASTELVSSPVGVSSQTASDKGTLSLYASSSQSSPALESAESVLPVYSQESLSSVPSIQAQGSTSLGSSRPEMAGGSRQSFTQELSGSYSGQSSSQYSPGSLTSSKLGSNQPTSAQSQSMSNVPSRSGSLLGASRYRPVQSGSGSRDLSSPKPQSTSAQYSPASKYVPVSSPQAVFGQSGSSRASNRPVTQVGTLSQAGTSSQFTTTRGGGGYYSGSIPQSQSSLGQFVPASPSKYVPMSSQGYSSQPTSVVSSQGRPGTLGTASYYASQGMSSTYSGSVQPQGTTSQLGSLPSVLSQSTSEQSVSRQTPTLQVGVRPQKAASQFISQQGGSGYYSSSSPPSQSSLGQYAPASPSKYVPMSSQGFSSQSAPAQSSRRGSTSTFLGSQSGSSLSLQAGSVYGGSYSQPQGAISQFASGPPSQYASLSSPQAVASQYSQASQSVYSSQSQKPQNWQPSASSWTQGVQASGTATSQGSYQSQVPSRFSLSTGGTTYQSSPPASSGGSGQLVSTQGRGGSYGGMSLQSPSTSSLHTLGSPAYAKLGSSSMGFSSQSTSDQSSSSLSRLSSQRRDGAQFAASRYASLQGGSSSAVGSSPQPQRISSQYAPAPSFQAEKAPVLRQPIQASPSGPSVSLSQQSQNWQPSVSSWTQGVQTSDTAVLQSVPSSAQTSSRFSSMAALSRPVDSVAQSSQKPTSVSRRTQSLFGGVQRPSRLLSSQAASGSTVGSQTLQRPAGSNLAPSPGLSAQMSSVGMLSGLSLPQTVGEYQSYNQESSTSVTGENAPFQGFPNYEQNGVGQEVFSVSGFEDSSKYGSLSVQNAPVSSQPSHSFSGWYSSEG